MTRAGRPAPACLAAQRPGALNRPSYNAIASAWDAARVSLHGRERACLETMLDGVDAPANVLDLGCGTGRPIAAHILGRGHHLTGVDQAEALLDLARSRFPAARWIQGDIETFETDERFGAIVCWDTLFHIERSAHARLFEHFAAMSLPGARLMLTVGGSEHPAFTDTMFGHTFFYDSHPPRVVLEMLAEAGFRPIVAEFMNLPTSGRDKGRYAIVAAID